MKVFKVLMGLVLFWSIGFQFGTPKNPLHALIAYASGGGYSYDSYDSYKKEEPKAPPKPVYPSQTYERNITNETNPVQIDLIAREAYDELIVVDYKTEYRCSTHSVPRTKWETKNECSGYGKSRRCSTRNVTRTVWENERSCGNKQIPIYGSKHHEPVTTSVSLKFNSKGRLKLYGGQYERFTIEARGDLSAPEYYLVIDSQGYLYGDAKVKKTVKGFKVTLTAVGRCSDENLPLLEKCIAEFKLTQ